MATYKCTGCKERFSELPCKTPAGQFHDYNCLVSYAHKRGKQAVERKKKKERLEYNRETIRRRVAAEGRLDLYKKLGKLVNQYAKHVVYKGCNCYTCDKSQSFSDSPTSFHAGHYMPAKRTDPRRFMVENIRIQCYKCNCQLSGNQAVYRVNLVKEKGEDHVLWLEAEANHKSLKDVYPDLDYIRADIAKYRKLLRDNGLTP